MSSFRLLIRGILFHWRMHLAVVLGVLIATAVICGALIVGDSVSDSLRQLSLDRLGGVDHSLTGFRFVREELAAELQTAIETQPGDANKATIAPALVMQGSMLVSERNESGEIVTSARAGGIQVYGVDQRFWEMMVAPEGTLPIDDAVVISRRLADELSVEVGESLSLIVEIPAAIPRDSLLGDRESTVTELAVQVSAVVDDEATPARFSLSPSQQFPKNAFVALPTLQRSVGLQEIRPTAGNPELQPARVNALFVGRAAGESGAAAQFAAPVADELTTAMDGILTLEDLSLRIVANAEHGYLSLESQQMILQEALAEAAEDTAEKLQLETSPVLVYLLNEIWNASDATKYSMYSVAAGIDPADASPFGPWEFLGEPPQFPLDPDQVLISDWLADDLQVELGDTIGAKYHVVGDRGELPEDEIEFTVAGIIALTGPVADPGITPLVPGITDAEGYENWREPFPLDRPRITPRDHEYWDEHGTTPKVFLSLAAAQDLWRSRYGQLTSLRISPNPDGLEATRTTFESELQSRLDASGTGLAFLPIKQMGLDAAAGTTNFTGLFIGFSFFLIAAAELLVALMFRLGLERRVAEQGLLAAVGWPRQKVARLFLAETALVVVAGGLIGIAVGVAYAMLMVHGLKTWWIGAIGTRHLFVSIHPVSLLIGAVISIVTALAAVWWSLRSTRRFSVRQLLQGSLDESAAGRTKSRRSLRLGLIVAAASLLLMLATIAGIVPATEAFSGFSWQVVAFFLVGTGVLVAGIQLMAAWIDADRALPIRGAGRGDTPRLGIRNASRHRSRSLMTTSLMAAATFVVVAVAAGRKNPAVEAPQLNSGNGGYSLIGDASTPILYDLNTDKGRAELRLGVGADEAELALLDDLHVAPFRVIPGDDASCLNLYQARRPTILGVPDEVLTEFDSSGRFAFANTRDPHIWPKLREPRDDDRIPVIGDMNTLMYSLHKGVGDFIEISDPDAELEVVGMLSGSIFQGVLLMSEESFQRLFPQQVGFSTFLVEVEPSRAEALSQLLESDLDDYGFDAERVADRLAEFLSVQNTYLLTFQTLGGLGLLLGTFGLASVMLRNVLERRGELALLRAVGFPRSQVSALVLWENSLLTVCGLALGSLSALLAMAPHLLSVSADIAWGPLLALLLGVFVLGMLSALWAVREAQSAPVVQALRGE